MLVQMVGVASCGVGLPDLDEAVTYRTSVAIEDAACNDDPLPYRLAGMLAGQIVVKLLYSAASVCRTRGVRERPGENDERLLRRPQPRRHVVRVQVGWLPLILRSHTGGFIGGLLSHPRFSLLLQVGFSTTMAMPCPTPMHIVASP